MTALSILDRERTIAGPGFSRWMVPPAALCIHLCIGQAYAFSVFNLPLSRLVGIDHSAPGDWKLTDIGWIFTLGIFFLGVAKAQAYNLTMYIMAGLLVVGFFCNFFITSVSERHHMGSSQPQTAPVADRGGEHVR